MASVAGRYVGSPIKRLEDTRLLTGQGRYVDDVQPAGALHAAFVRSTVAHGRIVKVDVDAAREADGVVAVFTGEEMERLLLPPGGMGVGHDFMLGEGGPRFTALCTDKVRLVGDPIVMVLAHSRYHAEDACETVEVEIEDLPAVASAQAALDSGSPPLFEDHRDGNIFARTEPTCYGDVNGVFAGADRVVRAHLSQHRYQAVPIEGRGVVADFDPTTGRLTLTAASRRLHLVRSMMAIRLGLEPEQVRVMATDIGGAFGLKFASSREELAVAAASKHLGRPVKWTEDRNENLLYAGQSREESCDVEVAFTEEGDILGLKVSLLRDAGAYPGIGPRLDGLIQVLLPGPYKMKALSFESTTAFTNKAVYVSYRGPWLIETFVRERMVDLVARELNLDPLELRLRNVVTGGEPPLETVTGRSLAGVTNRDQMQRIAEVVDFAEFRSRQHAARAEGRLLGLGVASFIEPAPGPRDRTTQAGRGLGLGPGGVEHAWVRLDRDGTVVLSTGQMGHGQGYETTLGQVVADQMGVAFEQVRVVYGDTDITPYGESGGSRSAAMAGGAALVASRELRRQVLDLAGEMLEASVEDLDIIEGNVSVRGVPASALSLAAVAEAVAIGRFPSETETNLEVALTYDGGQGGWSSGTHCAQVEIDPGTGAVEVTRYVVVEDCGEMINPGIVEGQVCGGVAQGIGAVLLEQTVYDENGQCLTGSLMDYLLPTATDIPHIEIHHIQTVPLDEDVNFRGVGEGGKVVSPVTVCNAIEDALAHMGVRIYEQHLPPARILELIGVIEPDA
jgi:aerobic carbon-monoxide dehydrogenase large subunit